MAFKYHKPTRERCEVCETLERELNEHPIISTSDGKASSANHYPFHNWYNFVLGYVPDFPLYIINKFHINPNNVILDPFMGSATTNVVAKSLSIPSFGIEANDYFIGVGTTKLTWDIDIKQLKNVYNKVLDTIDNVAFKYNLEDESDINLFSGNREEQKDFRVFNKLRPKEMEARYISDKPFAKLMIVQQAINDVVVPRYGKPIYNFFHTAFSSIIVPSSNVSYGPGFGVKKAKTDFDVFGKFRMKVDRMIDDLESVENSNSKKTPFSIIHGDARQMANYLKPESVDCMITSPPYPGDHEYTKYTKLELMIENNIVSKSDFRTIKKRMLVGSTTNIYKECNDRMSVDGNELITQVTDEIQRRLDSDGATSGYEKLYTKLVWEYFGGMAKVFEGALKVLKPGGTFSLLVSDSHAFKMVHIRTAVILRDIALRLGFAHGEIELWQNKRSTSHPYNLREEILILTK